MRSQLPERAQTAGTKDLYMTAGQFLGEELNGVENAHFADTDGSPWKNISETSIKRLDILTVNDYD